MTLRDKRKAKQRFPKPIKKYPGRLGDGFGNVRDQSQVNHCYVRIGGMVQSAFNDQTEYRNDIEVECARDDTGLFKVLGTRTASPGGPTTQLAGMSFESIAKALEYMRDGGGSNPLWVQSMQIMMLRVGQQSGMTIQVQPGLVWSGSADLFIPFTTLDMTAHRPSTAGKAALVLITVKNDGTLVATKGSEFTLASMTTANLMLANRPSSPALTVKELALVRVYTGQAEVNEGRVNTDFIDLRFTESTSSGSHGPVTIGTANGLSLAGQVLSLALATSLVAGAMSPADYTKLSNISNDRRYVALYNHFIGSGTVLYDIGLATSNDGRKWTIETEPVISHGSTGAWDDHTTQFPYLLDVDGVLWAYYSGKDSDSWTNFKIGLSRSYDKGLTWTKYSGNPVLSGISGWENSLVADPAVLYDRDEPDSSKRWKMWYLASSFGEGVGYAYSADGLSWTRGASNPVISPGSTGAWDDTYVSPHAVIKRGDIYILFYGGYHGAVWKNGIATFTNPEGTYTKFNGGLPILGGDGLSTSLTATLASGTTTATVTNASIFPIGCPVWVSDSTHRYLTRVIKINSSTSLELADAAPVTISTTGGDVRSVAAGSLDITGVRYDDGYIFTVTPHQPDGLYESGVHELSMLAFASEDFRDIRIDYSAGVTIPITVAESQSASVTRENWSLVDLWQSEQRHQPFPDVVSGGVSGLMTGSDKTKLDALRLMHYEPIVFNDELLIFNHDLLTVEIEN